MQLVGLTAFFFVCKYARDPGLHSNPRRLLEQRDHRSEEDRPECAPLQAFLSAVIALSVALLKCRLHLSEDPHTGQEPDGALTGRVRVRQLGFASLMMRSRAYAIHKKTDSLKAIDETVYKTR